MENSETLSHIRIIKHDGRIVSFEPEKITFAIFRALRATDMADRTLRFYAGM